MPIDSSRDPLALLIGMVLDQQVPLEKAFAGPWVLRQRLGTPSFDAAKIAAMAPDELAALFVERPALASLPGRRWPPACRTFAGCSSSEYGGNAAAVWTTASRRGEELFKRVKALPGFGEQKARIFVALLGKQLGVRPPGWRPSGRGRSASQGRSPRWPTSTVRGPCSRSGRTSGPRSRRPSSYRHPASPESPDKAGPPRALVEQDGRRGAGVQGRHGARLRPTPPSASVQAPALPAPDTLRGAEAPLEAG